MVDIFIEWMFVFTLNNVRFLLTHVKLRDDYWYKSRYFKFSVFHFFSTLMFMDTFLSGYCPESFRKNVFDQIVIQDCNKIQYFLYFDEGLAGARTIGIYYAFVRFVVLVSLWLEMKNLQYLLAYQDNKNKALKTQLVNSISKEIYSIENNFTHDKQCWICYKDYVEGELVTRLTCDHRHYFHTDCLI